MLTGSLLQRLQAAHEGTVRPLKFGVYYKQTLVALCHALEDYILSLKPESGAERPLMIAAFQRGKWYLEEAERYQQLAQRSAAVVILAQPDAGFAEHPTSQGENVCLVPLQPTDPVAQEWHLIILSPCYTAMVLCQELSPADYGEKGQPTVDQERKFYGFWTFEPPLVEETVALALDHVDTYDAPLAQRIRGYFDDYQRQGMAFEDLSTVVATVVDYLNASQATLQPHCPLGLGAMGSQSLRLQEMDQNLVSNEIQAFLRMAQIFDQSDLSNPCVAAEVTALVEALGQLLELPVWQLRRLRLAALLHRLDPLRSGQSWLEVAPQSLESRTSCPLVPAAQVLRKMPQLRAVAQIVTHLTERWDGLGQPAGLAGEEIPLEARILGLMVDFQQEIAHYIYQGHSPQEAILQTLSHCQEESGRRWDPQLVDSLSLLVQGILSGWELQWSEPNPAVGLWLLEGTLS
jgi:DICT domain-containing protein